MKLFTETGSLLRKVRSGAPKKQTPEVIVQAAEIMEDTHQKRKFVNYINKLIFLLELPTNFYENIWKYVLTVTQQYKNSYQWTSHED